MKYIIADNAGFCFGVKRAMNMAWEEITQNRDKKIYALGPLIHNKQAVSKYEDEGLITVDEIDEIKDADKMIIRSHGVGKVVYDGAGERNIEIVDTTCPFVLKIHNIVRESRDSGREIIIVGDKNHPEVRGINGWCDNSAVIIKTEEEAEKLQPEKNRSYTIVAQTTMNEKIFDNIIEIINRNFGDADIELNNTICSATKVRQQSARELAGKVDCMIVIGGTHSSNTQKLASICREYCDTYAIETFRELDRDVLKKYGCIGITAGASTPDWIIKEVTDFIESI